MILIEKEILLSIWQTIKKEVLMSKYSFFANYHVSKQFFTFEQILDTIKDGKYENRINELREHANAGNEVQADLVKKKLPSFTPSGVFKESRSEGKLVTFSIPYPPIFFNFSQIIC
jgi:hypothetical protein